VVKTVVSQLEGLLTLDYFELFDKSVASWRLSLLGLVWSLRNPCVPQGADSAVQLGRVPLQLIEDLGANEDEANILTTICNAYRIDLVG